MDKELAYKLNRTLEPCPHCGCRGKVEIQRGFIRGESCKVALVYCTGCHARGPKLDPREFGSQTKAAEEAVRLWNRRTHDDR